MSLHDQIMNLPCQDVDTLPSLRRAHKEGHRDARHAAAELAIAVEQQRDELLAVLKASRATLQHANDAPHPFNAIKDTIWHTQHETLFDFMDAAIEKAEAKQ